MWRKVKIDDKSMVSTKPNGVIPTDVFKMLMNILQFSPAPWAAELLKLAEQADTPQELSRLINEAAIMVPVGGN